MQVVGSIVALIVVILTFYIINRKAIEKYMHEVMLHRNPPSEVPPHLFQLGFAKRAKKHACELQKRAQGRYNDTFGFEWHRALLLIRRHQC